MDRQDIMTEGLIDLSEAPTLRARRDALGRLGRYAAAGLVLPPGLAALPALAGGGSNVYWAGPSVGFDVGGNASKVFTLVYKLPKASAIYRRFPGVDGSLYYIGGAGVNYQRADGITLAPIRLGVGLRAGASVGYVHYRREKSINPF